MNLSGLIPLIGEVPAYGDLLSKLAKTEGEQRAVVIEAAKPYLAAALHKDLDLPLLLVLPSPEEAKRFYDELSTWCGEGVNLMLFPEPDALPYEKLTPDPITEQQRLQVLSEMATGLKKNSLIVCSATALVRKTVSPDELASVCHTLTQGMHADPSELLARWNDMGYQRETVVQVPGTMSQRGGILDIYPPDSEMPARIEFFGNEIESIRFFDPQSQRSLQPVSSVTVIPATENALSGTIIDYLSVESLLILDEPTDIETCVTELDTQAQELRQSQIEEAELQEDTTLPYLTYPELEAKLGKTKKRLILNRWSAGEDASYRMTFAPAPSYGGQLKGFLDEVKTFIIERRRVIVTSYQSSRLSELLEEEGIFSSPLFSLEQAPLPGSLVLIQGSLSEGWMMGDDAVLLTDAEIFGFVKQRRRLFKKRPVDHRNLMPELTMGDFAVHADHGVARFVGMIRKRLDESEREYLVLEYSAGDRIYVPSEQADRVSRYVGSGDAPSLTRLGTYEWARIRQRVEKSTREMAQELIALYASREVTPAYAFSPDTVWQRDLEASFPYMETPDQAEAVQRVKEDMEKPKPLDRLICGDVGYGKTEVALRAAFKAVMDGKQVAILVPTTVLANQHFTTFTQRLAAFPVTVEMLSRFRSDKEQKDIIESLAHGGVDICIGTHRLLQKDVAFKDLGLVIIDEEQRFGVAHKERLKKMRKEVDVLTLSATPIPRTLHMSLVGVRDMSTMETPPEERSPIKTYVAEYSESLVREAIIREIERNGQVFFVHNRVQSINSMAYKLSKLVPEAEIIVGHGQMKEDELEKAMLDFTQGKADVLLCTTIIESGLDIPNANTLIINDADRFGLSQLYQLRGRVGRGANRAYAYFLYGKGKRLTPTAVKRLQTIFEATELGAGFRIAMKDLEIRGAGNLLGREQSGHIAAVGFDLYCQLLTQAVEEEKVKKEGEDGSGNLHPSLPPATIDLPMPAYIPEDYVTELGSRLTLYQRLAKIFYTEEVEQLAEELKDRFGDLPPQVENLLYIVRIKALATQAGVESIYEKGDQIIIRVISGIVIDRQRLLREWRGLRIGNTQIHLNVRSAGAKWQGVLEGVVREL